MVSSSSSLLFPLVPLATDGVETETTEEQSQTEAVIRELLALYIPQPGKPASSVPLRTDELALNRKAHIRWLKGILSPLPAPYTSLDASRPWLVYWVAHSLALLGTRLDAETRKKAIATLKSFYNATEGGFGGGPGQMAHLAPTYATVSALCYLGDGSEDWDWIDRQAIHSWMLTLKQADGSFVMHKGGEVDVRGCYCAITTAVLLNILTPELAKGTSDFIASCQTYEGGMAAASQPAPAYTPNASPAPLGEAHGGYTFCAFASYFALQASPSLHLSNTILAHTNGQTNGHSGSGQPSSKAGKAVNIPLLLRWASSMQGSPIEAGGFRGRSNKLVDGCYSWWCGGLFAMINASIPPSQSATGWPEDEPDLFNRTALQEYVLVAAQAQHGGLRDKPGKNADAYHSCYNLSGLSAAQHAMYHAEPEQKARLEADWVDVEENGMVMASETLAQANKRMKDIYVAALAWQETESKKIVVGIKENETEVTHPVYNLEIHAMERMMAWSYRQPESRTGILEVA